MSQFNAYQIEVTSPTTSLTQVFFVAATSEDEALTRLASNSTLLPQPVLKMQRRISDSEIDLHQIGPDTITQWV